MIKIRRSREVEVKKMKKLKKRFEIDTLNTIEAFACQCGCPCGVCACSCIPTDIEDRYADVLSDKQGETGGTKDNSKQALLGSY